MQQTTQKKRPTTILSEPTFSVTARAYSISSLLVKLSVGLICRAPAFWTR